MWKLYRRGVMFGDKRLWEYAWGQDDTVFYNRFVSVPIGWHLVGTDNYLSGKRIRGLGFRRVKTEMTQEQLSKGWFV